MLELNRNAEVSIHACAADMEFVLARAWETTEETEKSRWSLTIEGVPNYNIAEGLDDGLPKDQPMPRPRKELQLSDEQAAAVMALFTAGDHVFTDAVVKELYALAEPVFAGVENHFRVIP